MGVMHDIFKKGNYVDNPYKSFFEIKAKDLNKNMIHMNQFYKNIVLVVNISPIDKNLKEEYENLETERSKEGIYQQIGKKYKSNKKVDSVDTGDKRTNKGI